MTPDDVKDFCRETRQLAANLRTYFNKLEPLRAQAPIKGLTASEKKRIERALMVLESEMERWK